MRYWLVILLILIAGAVVAPHHDPQAVSILHALQGPSAQHWLGTDSLGRDVLARLIEGGKTSLFFALLTVMFSGVIGVTLGLIAGLIGGVADRVIMRLCDLILALPLLPFLIVMAAIDPSELGFNEHSSQARIVTLTLVIALFSWPGVTRLVRASAQSIARKDYVRAATALGLTRAQIAWRHVLPMVAAPAIVALTLAMGHVILLESTLSFLGLGLQPPTPSWGSMLNTAQNSLWSAPHLAIWPGLAIAITVITLNLLGDRLRDWLDPHKNK